MIFYWVCTHQVCTHQVYLGFTEVGLNKFHGHHFSVLNHHFCYTKHGRRLGVSPVPGQTQFHIAGYTQFIYIYLYIYVSIHINYVCNRHIRTNIDVSYFPITSHYVMIAYTRYIRHLTKKTTGDVGVAGVFEKFRCDGHVGRATSVARLWRVGAPQ